MTNTVNILAVQTLGIDQKIVAAFERIAQGLRTLAWKTGKPLLLNPAQTQLLVFLLNHDKQTNRISTLALEFNITKASLSETVSSLERKGLICKSYTEMDKRNCFIVLTQTGQLAAQEAALYSQKLLSAINSIPALSRQELFSALGDIIFHLHSNGIISVQRMCLTCKYHQTDGDQHFCNLLNRNLHIYEMQLDCPDHQTPPPNEVYNFR